MNSFPRGVWIALYCTLLALAVWYGWNKAQEPRSTAEDECQQQCSPLPWKIKKRSELQMFLRVGAITQLLPSTFVVRIVMGLE